MFQRFDGKTIVVTGGSKGIGKGIAKVFASAGANVAILARTTEEAEATAKEIQVKEGQTHAVFADVKDYDSIKAAVDEVADKYGGIDVLCANAGIFPSASIEDMTSEEWDHVMDTNTKGTFHSVKACIPYLKKADYGRIVITSSITGSITGYPGWVHYSTSKAGQLGFMRSTALELAHDNITVNAVLPGNVMTEGLQGMGEGYLNDMAQAIPLKKLGKVEDIGYAALFLASKEAGFITGQSIVVDGGQVLPED